MREIKFRAWHKDDGMLSKVDVISWEEKNQWIGHEPVSRFVEVIGGYSRYEDEGASDMKDVVLMQWTGLHDKNGKEIYEGDVVRGTTDDWDEDTKTKDRKVVEWDSGTSGFSPFCFYDGDCGTQTTPSKVEIIGNIYENPELLAN